MRKLIWRGLVAHRMRLVVTAVAIALGVGFVAGTFVLTDTLRASIDSVLNSAQTATSVVVYPQTALKTFGGNAALGDHGLSLPDSTIDRVVAVPGVAEVTGIAVGSADVVGANGRTLGSSSSFQLVLTVGTHPSLNPLTLRSGHFPRAPGTAVLDAETAKREHISIGAIIKVAGAGSVAAGRAAPSGKESTNLKSSGSRPYRVVGIVGYGTGETLAGATIVGLPLGEAQAVLGLPKRISEVAVSAKPGITERTLAKRVAAALGPQFLVETKAAAQGSVRGAVDKGLAIFDDVLLVFAGIALFVAVFLILNTFSILVAQRSRELALLRCLGAYRRQLVIAVVVEAAIVGTCAAAFGVGLGVLLAIGLRAVLDAAGVALPAEAPVVAVRTVVVSMLTGILATVVAALVPAWRGSRSAPVAALREEPNVDAGRSAPVRRIIGVGFVILGVAIDVSALHANGGRSSNSGNRAEMAGIGLVFGFLGLAALVPLVVRPVAGVLGWPLAVLWRVPGRLGRRNAVRHPRRTAATAAALMIGLTLMTSIAVLSQSVQASQTSSLDRGLLARLIVTPNGASSMPRSLVNRLTLTPGITDVAPLSEGKGVIELPRPRPGLSKKVALAGAPPSIYAKDVSIPVYSGSLGDMGPNSIAITTGIAATWHLKVGSLVPMGSPAVALRSFTVAAVIGDPTGITGDVLATTAGFAGLFPQDDGAVAQVFVQAAPDARGSSVIGAMRSVLHTFPQAEYKTKIGFIKRANQGFHQMIGIVTALLGLAVVIALFGIVNTLALSIIERRREIGLLRALGLSRRQLRGAIRVEAVIVALLGTVLGIVLGLLFGWVIVRSLQSDGVDILQIPTREIVSFVIASALAGVLAAAIPARSAAKVDVLAAIATE